jgi:alkanesulfonate monooxygenase SsuD/methylene tetrahydromethanopterin reductase-like flavin-dependent oxidoreductase (luciferase family)
MAKTKFGIFSLSQVPDLAKVVQSFDDDLSFFELAERLGYDRVWIAEHLFSSYGLVTSTQVYAAAIAQRTKKVRIGMAVCAIPFNHDVEWFYAKVTANQLAGAPQVGEAKGYELTMREGKKTREMGYLSFDKLHQYGACIADDPETCVAKLKDMKRRFGITEFVFWFNIGGIDRTHVERAMQLAAEQVMPHV